MKTILLVEDERDLAEGLELVFGDEGYNVYRVQTAEEALELCLVLTPVLIISEIQLGGTDGLALLKAVRGIGRLHRVPVVLISAINNVSLSRLAKEFGAAAFFPKPFYINELFQVVYSILSSYKKHVTSV